MEEYKSNSNRNALEPVEKKDIKPVTTGTVKKKSGLSKAADNFIKEDVSNVKNYVVGDVLIPALKKAISDVITNGIDMLLYGETRGSNNSGRRTSNISYYNYSSADHRDDRRPVSNARAGYSFDDVVINSRAEAEEVLSRMDELMATYGMVSVADYYDLVGAPCAYTDNKYGWTNLRSAEVRRVRDGYILVLPRVSPLD